MTKPVPVKDTRASCLQRPCHRWASSTLNALQPPQRHCYHRRALSVPQAKWLSHPRSAVAGGTAEACLLLLPAIIAGAHSRIRVQGRLQQPSSADLGGMPAAAACNNSYRGSCASSWCVTTSSYRVSCTSSWSVTIGKVIEGAAPPAAACNDSYRGSCTTSWLLLLLLLLSYQLHYLLA